jgi:quercetin dioxygenase-like cupin family protein
MVSNYAMTIASMAKMALLGAAATVLMLASSSTLAQATSRPCNADGLDNERPGPACLLAHAPLGKPPADALYWSLYNYPTVEAARAESGNGSVINAFGKIWLFTVGPVGTRPLNGQHIADVGPMVVDRNVSYDAEFLQSIFSPGMTAPIHVHSGPEAFYAVSGDTCLETPDGVQVGRGAGNSMTVRGGPPMLLMALGPDPRKGFALILHDASLPPTTLVHHWAPKGLCQAERR